MGSTLCLLAYLLIQGVITIPTPFIQIVGNGKAQVDKKTVRISTDNGNIDNHDNTIIQNDSENEITNTSCSPVVNNAAGNVIINCNDLSRVLEKPLEESSQETYKKEAKPTKLRKDIGLKNSPNAEVPPYCLLQATDYVLPLETVKSQNQMWCKIKVVDSKNCNRDDKGFIRPNYLSTGCI